MAAKLQRFYKMKKPVCPRQTGFAERGGFEPPVQFPVRQFSKLVVSATHPPLQNRSAKVLFCLTSPNLFVIFTLIYKRNDLKQSHFDAIPHANYEIIATY